MSKEERLWLVSYLRGETGGQWLLKCGEEVCSVPRQLGMLNGLGRGQSVASSSHMTSPEIVICSEAYSHIEIGVFYCSCYSKLSHNN